MATKKEYTFSVHSFGGALFIFRGHFSMIVTFCGHSQFSKAEKCEAQLLSLLKNAVGDNPAEFFLGGYGAFDDFAYSCCKKYQMTHPDTKLIFITPYLFGERNLKDKAAQYDAIIYPEIESAPPRYAISHRNRWMVEKADLVICFITHQSGGAYQTYLHAVSRNKPFFNIANHT